jgi:hypothetical protein
MSALDRYKPWAPSLWVPSDLEFAVPKPGAHQLRANLLDRGGEYGAQKLVSALADCVLCRPSVELLSSPIPVTAPTPCFYRTLALRMSKPCPPRRISRCATWRISCTDAAWLRNTFLNRIIGPVQNGAKLSAFWIILRPEGTGGFLSALHFGGFQRRKPEIHCADDAVHLLRIACADNRTGHCRMAQRPGDGGFTRRTAMQVAHSSQPFD